MQLRTLSRVTGALGAGLLVVATVLSIASPSSALEQERVTAIPDQVVVKDYSPLIGNNQSALVSPSLLINYENCLTDPSCDVIPLTVPQPATDDDFFLTITLEWETEEVKQVPLLGDTATNDLDLWITNDPFNETAGPDEDGFAYHSAGVSEPERVQMFSPVGNWHVFVVNASGINTGYRLTFDWGTDLLPTVFESLPPSFAPPAARPAARPTPAAPAPALDFQPAPAVEPAPLAPVKPNLALPSAPIADTAFSAPAGPALEDQLAAPEAIRPITPASAVKAAPPSTATLILWMLALPLLVVAVGAFLLSRRQSSLIRI